MLHFVCHWACHEWICQHMPVYPAYVSIVHEVNAGEKMVEHFKSGVPSQTMTPSFFKPERLNQTGKPSPLQPTGEAPAQTWPAIPALSWQETIWLLGLGHPRLQMHNSLPGREKWWVATREPWISKRIQDSVIKKGHYGYCRSIWYYMIYVVLYVF